MSTDRDVSPWNTRNLLDGPWKSSCDRDCSCTHAHFVATAHICACSVAGCKMIAARFLLPSACTVVASCSLFVTTLSSTATTRQPNGMLAASAGLFSCDRVGWQV